MKNTKTIFGVYAAWSYQKEIEDLNKQSENGWQLVKGGLFSNKFVKNEDVRYVYQLDYNPNVDDKARYIETFREQGWEYINSLVNGWHYFRKIYDQSLPEEEYQIYCDNQDLSEMHSRWRKAAIRLSVLVGLMFLVELYMNIRKVRLPGVLLCAILFIEFIILMCGNVVLKNKKLDSAKKGNKISLLMGILFAGLILNIVSMCYRPEDSKMSALDYGPVKSEAPAEIYTTKIYYPDFYHFNFRGSLGNSVELIMVNKDNGSELFKVQISPDSEGKIDFTKKMNFLKPGKYSIYCTHFAGGKMDLRISVD